MDVDEELIPDLRRALARLHDPAYLENHPLALRLSAAAQAPGLSSGQALSRILRLAIEALDPGPNVAPSAPEARPYHVLRSRYISQHGVTRIGQQLGIGERQTYRELRRGVEALAHILCGYGIQSGHDDEPWPEPLSSPAARVFAEIARLSSAGHQAVDVVQVVGEAVESVRRLAREWDVQIEWLPEVTAVHAMLNRVMLRQAILNLLSHAIRSHRGSHLEVRLQRLEENAMLLIRFDPGRELISVQPGHPYAMATELLNSLGVNWCSQEQEDGAVHITIRVPLVRQRTILIVDDNVGLLRLFERYLEGRPYVVYGSSSAANALDVLSKVQPDVVILDIMMPERDGWEVLQALRQSEAGRRVRVLVCSIIDDPDLARSLGADGFLHKPVDRASLIHALEEVLSAPA